MKCGELMQHHGRFGKIKDKFWKNKKVLITGHTGFKGSWFSLYLFLMGANLYGYSLKQNKKFSIFNLLKLKKIFKKNYYGDIRNKSNLEKLFKITKPHIAVHMAAQPLVITSYKKPLYTYDVNINGTINFLECCLKMKRLKSVLIITTDKCYENVQKLTGYKETEKLGGNDPYSSSKAACEIIVNGYRKSFFMKKKINIATARAGNVIGGGDWSDYRLFVDIVKNKYLKKKLEIRNYKAIRPWQHVIDVTFGYSLLLKKLYNNSKYATSWNFGPKNTEKFTVGDIVNLIYKNKTKKNMIIKIKPFHEEKILKLDSTKANKELGWFPKKNTKEAVNITLDWYDYMFKNNNSKLYNFTLNQIKNF